MNHKAHRVLDALPKTLEWIWSTLFAEWLGSESFENIFWISGKPGSGKSTLLKYLVATQRTLQHLPQIVEPLRWVRLHFFFDFRAGSGIANTPLGMLRSFATQLGEVLPEKRNLLADLVARRHLDVNSVQDLSSALCRSINQSNLKILALVDGLDEYSGDSAELMKSLIVLRDHSGRKMCLASRPEGSLVGIFQQFCTIRMQDHNSKGIRAYIESAVNARRFNFRVAFTKSLRKNIVDSAQGVILLARFAVDDLVTSCEKGDTKKKLREKLEGLPQEIEGIYQRTLDRLPPDCISEAALILHLVLTSSPPVTIENLFAALIFVLTNIDGGTTFIHRLRLSDFESRLLALFGNLLDVTEVTYHGKYSIVIHGSTKGRTITATHKTLQSYLVRSDWIWNNLPPAFKQNYPDSPWFRIFARAIEKASVELDPEKASEALIPTLTDMRFGERTYVHFTARNLLTLHGSRSWVSLISFALQELFEHAREFERSHRSCHSVIGKAIKVPFVCLVALEKDFSTNTSYILRRYGIFPAVDLFISGLAELAIAASYGLTGLLQDRLLAASDLSPQRKQEVLDLLVCHYYANPDPPEYPETAMEVFQQLNGIQGRHFCLLMCIGVLYVPRALSVFQILLKSTPPAPWPWQHHPICTRNHPQSSLLYDWAKMLLDPTTDCDLGTVQPCLEFLLKTGEPINKPCYSGGNILHAILDPSVLSVVGPAWHKYPARILKFVCAIKGGADFRIVNEGNDALSYGRKLETHLRWRLLRPFHGDFQQRVIQRDFQEVKYIIQMLEARHKEGNWYLLDKCGEIVSKPIRIWLIKTHPKRIRSGHDDKALRRWDEELATLFSSSKNLTRS